MLIRLTCTLALVATVSVHPQEPRQQEPGHAAPATTPDTVIPFAAVLPPETLAVVAWNDLAPHMVELRRTSLYQLIQKLPVPGGATGALVEFEERLHETTGLDRHQLVELLSGGATIALTGIDSEGMPQVTIAASITSAELGQAISDAAGKLAADGTIHGIDGTTQAWSLDPEADDGAAFCVDHDTLLLATSTTALRAATARMSGERKQPSLADQPSFQEFSHNAQQDGAPLLACFLRPQLLIDHALSQLPTKHLQAARNLSQALAIQDIDHVSFTVRPRDGLLHDHLRIVMPEPRAGLLGALLGPGTEITAESIAAIPPGVSSFSVSHSSLQDIFDCVVNTVATVEPDAARFVTQAMRGLQQRTGVDLEQDVLRSLGDRIVTMQWPAEKIDSTDMAMLIESTDAWRLERSLRQLIERLGVSTHSSTAGDHEVHVFDALPLNVAVSPRFAVARDQLIFATSEESMAKVLAQLDAPQQNAAATELLGRLPAGTTWISWSDLEGMGRNLVNNLQGHSELSPGVMEPLAQALTNIRGSAEYTMALDQRGVSLRSHSTAGNIYGIVGAGVVAAVALPQLVDQRAAGPRRLGQVRPTAEVKALVQHLAAAEQSYHTEHGTYGSLQQLQGAGLVPKELQNEIDHGALRHGRFMLDVLLPESAANQQLQFAVVAWPDRSHTGSVLAASPDHELLRNDVIASSAGIGTAAATDLFLHGSFGGELAPGWQDEKLAVAAPDPTTTASGEEALIKLIVAAVDAGRTEAPEVIIQALRSPNPAIVICATHALGELGIKQGVPELCELVMQHRDPEVRLRAMAALRRLRDQRSVAASLSAMTAEQPLLRAMAAANLGQLRAPETEGQLLAALSVESTEQEQRDRVAVLLALTDLGSTESLLPAAALITTDHRTVGAALTYCFQTLSPNLPLQQEVSTLMAVLDHPVTMLRRYAIQRLGEIGDSSCEQALEGRLAAESNPALQPLIQVSLSAVRGAEVGTGGMAGLDSNAIVDFWNQLTLPQRQLAAGAGLSVPLLLALFLLLRNRRRRYVHGQNWAAMTAPSADDEYDDEYEAEYGDDEYDDEYEDEHAYAGSSEDRDW